MFKLSWYILGGTLLLILANFTDKRLGIRKMLAEFDEIQRLQDQLREAFD